MADLPTLALDESSWQTVGSVLRLLHSDGYPTEPLSETDGDALILVRRPGQAEGVRRDKSALHSLFESVQEA